MTQGTRTENIAAAKEDLQNFLLSLFEFVQLRSKWHWLGFGDKDAYRMIDSFSFARYLTADAVSVNFKYMEYEFVRNDIVFLQIFGTEIEYKE